MRRPISAGTWARYMRKIHSSGFHYAPDKMDSCEHFMRDCIGLRLHPRGNPFMVVLITGVDCELGKVKLRQGWDNDRWIDVDDLDYWEPAL